MTGPVAGIVLAGGRSSRFGPDKLAADYRGAPLLHRPVTRLAEIADEIVVVIAPDSHEPAMPVGVVVRFAHDATPAQGPLAGAAAGLAAVDVELAILVAGDMPELSTGVLLEMLRVAAERGIDAVALQDGDRFRPVPLIVRASAAREAAHVLLHRGERRLRALPQALRTAVIDEPTWVAIDPGRRTLIDIDEPGDLST